MTPAPCALASVVLTILSQSRDGLQLNYKQLEDLFAAVGAGKVAPRAGGNKVEQILDPKPEEQLTKAEAIAEVVKLWNYERGGIAVPLVIGNKGYGKYRWSVLDHKMKMKTYDGRGNVTSATVSVSLQEYLRG